MNRSEFLRAVLPPFLFSTLDVLRNNIIYRKIRNKSSVGKIIPTNKTICVLGNGPSLVKSIENYEKFMIKNDCLVVNYFANTNLYEKLKPNYYLFVDPCICMPFNEMSIWRKPAEDLVNNLIKKTNWDVNIILPTTAIDSEFVSRLKSNGNIFLHIYYINTIQFKKWNSIKTKYEYWNRNLIDPPAQTVMNTAVYLGLFLNYQETYIFGIDSNFLESLEVDQKTNILYNKDQHFYGAERLPWYKDATRTETGKLHEIVPLFIKMFEFYWDLRNYADYKKLKVYNASEFSMVDAFERKKPYSHG